MKRNAPDRRTASPAADKARIAHYYDANTASFLRLGRAQGTGAIHRAIWAPGVRTRREALHYLNAWIASILAPACSSQEGPLHLIDLGCGVGGTARFLAEVLKAHVTGVTISGVQAHMARRDAEAAGVADRCQFVEADFDALPPLPAADAVIAIESFVHAKDPARFFANAHALLKPGGLLILCDDFLSDTGTDDASPWIAQFRRGWHLNTLMSAADCQRLAQAQRFSVVEHHNLSRYLKGFPLAVLWPLAHLTKIPLPWPYWDNLAGGTALQWCVRKGLTTYHTLAFQKAPV